MHLSHQQFAGGHAARRVRQPARLCRDMGHARGHGIGHEYGETLATRGVAACRQVWWELNGVDGDKIARLMGAPAGSVLVDQNAIIANSILFSALDFSDTRRNKVVITDMDFPSDVY